MPQLNESENIAACDAPPEACQNISAQLEAAGLSLRRALDETHPHFMHSVRGLWSVAGETRELTQTMHAAADLIGSNNEGENALETSGKIIENILAKLDAHDRGINDNLEQVRDLVAQITQFRSINEKIETINASFQAVRINILIQCSARHIDEDIFQGVTSDIDRLSKTLRVVAGQIRHELFKATHNLTSLENKVVLNQKRISRLTDDARSVVQSAHKDIGKLLQVSKTMIEEAGSKSRNMNRKIDEIVVNMQFHDSLSQRADHILQSFADICAMCGKDNSATSPEQLGSAFLILDLQHRQLSDIIENIRLIHDQAGESFSAIREEVKGLTGIIQNREFQMAGRDNVLGDLAGSLLRALSGLGEQLADCRTMAEQIAATASSTKDVSDNLISLVEGVREMYEQIRIQAVNTIIMATNLDRNGLSIKVLAKEITTLSDQTGELLNEVDDLQKKVNLRVNMLCGRQENDATENGENSEMIRAIERTYSELAQSMSAIPPRVDEATKRIGVIQANLNFLRDLGNRFMEVLHRIETTRDALFPWKDSASADTQEIEKLINRYTMQRERTIHSPDREVTADTAQSEEEIFF